MIEMLYISRVESAPYPRVEMKVHFVLGLNVHYILGLKVHYNYALVMIWCDQIITYLTGHEPFEKILPRFEQRNQCGRDDCANGCEGSRAFGCRHQS